MQVIYGYYCLPPRAIYLPFVYFPFDQYPVGFLWMFELPLALIAFGVAVIIVRLKPDATY